MRAAIIRAAVAVVLAGAGSPAPALDYSGQLGFRYDRLDTWDAAGLQLTKPITTFDGNLDMAGHLVAPDVLRWSGGVSYSRYRANYPGYADESTGLGYHLGLGLFDFRGSNFTLNAGARRGTTDNAVQPSTGERLTGTTTQQSYSAGALLRRENRPALQLRGTRIETTNSGFGRETTTEAMNEVGATFQHGPGPFSYIADYTRSWNEASISAANYVAHQIGVSANAEVGAVVGSVTTRYVQRIPGTEDPLNPRTESNSTTVGGKWTSGDRLATATTTYAYGHYLLTAPATTAREQVSHALSSSAERALSEGWRGGLGLSLNLNQSRLGVEQETDTGQTASATVSWGRNRPDGKMLLLGASASVGVLEPRTGSAQIGYGGTFNGIWATPGDGPATRYSAEYRLDYRNDLYAQRGWTLLQRGSADATTVLASSARVKGTLAASGTRTSSPLYGARSSRNVAALGFIGWRRHSLSVTASLGDGVTGALSQSALGDGLFFPEKYDTHSRSLTVEGATGLTRRLSLSAVTRYTAVSSPVTPEQREAAFWGTLSYSLGLFRLSVENRYTMAGTTALDYRSNLLMVRLTRSIGGSF